MKKPAKRKIDDDPTGPAAVMRSHFHAFSKLAEQTAGARPLLRGLRVAFDPKADRIVAVHGATRVEFVLHLHADSQPPHAEIECRRINAVGQTEEATTARFRFDLTGVISESTVPDLVSQRIDQSPGAWSVVAAVIWDAMQA